LHGYAIIKRIAELTTVWKPTTGSIYPMLLHMEKEGFVSMETMEENGRKKKVYSITKNGLKELKAQQKMVEPMISNMNAMFRKLSTNEQLEPDHILEMISKAGPLGKEMAKAQQNILAFLILRAKAKITKSEVEKIRKKISELNSIISTIIRKKK